MRLNIAHSATGPANTPPRGFTVIEILIVLAIAGLILVMVLIAVPILLRNGRDHTRRETINYTMAALIEYRSNHGEYPISATSDERADFVTALQERGLTKLFTIRYTDNDGAHEYPFAGPDAPADPRDSHDTISITPAHRCNRTPGLVPGDLDYPLELVEGGHIVYQHSAIWGYLESGYVYCLDTQN